MLSLVFATRYWPAGWVKSEMLFTKSWHGWRIVFKTDCYWPHAWFSKAKSSIIVEGFEKTKNTIEFLFGRDYMFASLHCQNFPSVIFGPNFYQHNLFFGMAVPSPNVPLLTIMHKYVWNKTRIMPFLINFPPNKLLFVQIAPSLCKVSERRPLLAFLQYIIHRQ